MVRILDAKVIYIDNFGIGIFIFLRGGMAVTTLKKPSEDPSHQYNYDRDGFISKIKNYHIENFTHVDNALFHSKQQLQKAIASSDYENISGSILTFTRIYSMLLSVWCEARLHTLLYEDKVFEEDERAIVYNTDSVEMKWKTALAVSAKKYAGLAQSEKITEDNVDFSLFNIYMRIDEWIGIHFSPVIRNRNKVAHSQWVYPFTNLQGRWENSTSFNICPLSTQDFRTDNILLIEEKIKLFSVVAGSINSLAIGASKSTYNVLDFDDISKQVKKHIAKIENIDYPIFVKRVQASYKKQNPTKDSMSS